MGLADRLTYAALSGVCGLLLGLLGWFLYGMAYSLSYDGPGMDPVLRHWLVGVGGGFAVLGFFFGARVADWVGDTLSAILHFEWDRTPYRAGTAFVLVLVVLMVAAVWFSAPGR